MFLDIREPAERDAASIDGSLFIPMREIGGRLGELDADREIIVFCHLGARSAMVVQYLRGQGFARATSLAGGIDAWSREIDPEVPRYR